MRRPGWIVLGLGLLLWWGWQQWSLTSDEPAAPRAAVGHDGSADALRDTDGLPAEAHAVLARIVHGRPHPYPQDGGVFGNRERRLPARPRGYYREYTVPTPGQHDRGARRIVTGGDPPHEFWYTADHYRSFRAFALPASSRTQPLPPSPLTERTP